jgi:ring-1,2-phenylacetyl-CoA epoxidase subunit PaaE
MVSPRQASIHALRIAGIDRLSEDAMALTLDVPPELRDEYVFTAGQHVTLIGPDGARRPYSLCDPPSAGRWRIAVKQIPGGGFSDAVLPNLEPGDVLEVMTPSGRFTVTPDPDSTRWYAAVAAGSGITPILSIVGTLLEGEPGSFVTLVYANRTQATVMFADDVADLKDRFPERFQVLHVLSREQQDNELLSGRLDPARLRGLIEAFLPVPEIGGWFLCGPQQMVVDLSATLREVGVAPTAIHTELFHAEPVRRAEPVSGTDDAATVRFRLAGRESRVEVPRGGPSVLEAALTVRSDLPFACRGGVCGTCRARVVEGAVEMDANWALEDDDLARGYVLTCQSHPTTDEVVLDYDG